SSLFYKKEVLNNINLEIKKGETFGLIGKNGSGKSTLLRLISEVLYPSKGKITVNGKVAPLLSLGVGLQPELSGYDNIKLCCALLGYSKREIKEAKDDILAFSELTEEDLSMQVKRYSSGMKSRLSFSIATAQTPEILLVDEVLSVGDLSFKKKCTERINEIKKSGSTILFVSHSLKDMLDLCDRGAYIAKGDLMCVDSIDKVVGTYKQSV
ncbi:MAG: ABC transporter ATP-binding protein, partial [Cyclobacteriaceae bacterium]